MPIKKKWEGKNIEGIVKILRIENEGNKVEKKSKVCKKCQER